MRLLLSIAAGEMVCTGAYFTDKIDFLKSLSIMKEYIKVLMPEENRSNTK